MYPETGCRAEKKLYERYNNGGTCNFAVENLSRSENSHPRRMHDGLVNLRPTFFRYGPSATSRTSKEKGLLLGVQGKLPAG